MPARILGSDMVLYAADYKRVIC